MLRQFCELRRRVSPGPAELATSHLAQRTAGRLKRQGQLCSKSTELAWTQIKCGSVPGLCPRGASLLGLCGRVRHGQMRLDGRDHGVTGACARVRRRGRIRQLHDCERLPPELPRGHARRLTRRGARVHRGALFATDGRDVRGRPAPNAFVSPRASGSCHHSRIRALVEAAAVPRHRPHGVELGVAHF